MKNFLSLVPPHPFIMSPLENVSSRPGVSFIDALTPCCRKVRHDIPGMSPLAGFARVKGSVKNTKNKSSEQSPCLIYQIQSFC